MRCRTAVVVGEADHLRDELLAAVVGRVALAGDDDLHRPLGIEQQRTQPLRVAQHQRQPLVRRHAAREPDGEHVGVERAVRSSPARPRSCRAASEDARIRRRISCDQPLAQGVADLPQLARRRPCRSPSQPPPWARTAGPTSRSAISRISRDIQVGACTPLVTERDRHLVRVEARPEVGEHAAADLAVQHRDAVGALAEPQAHVRHVEDRRVVLGAEREDALDRHAAGMPPRCAATRSRSKRSMPAGTGVCVVNTVPARTACSASSKSRPSFSTSSRMRSMPRKPAWPSLVWNTSGAGAPVAAQYARIARTPPTPSSSSCSRRCSRAAAVEPVGDLAGGERRSPRCRCRAAAAARVRRCATQTCGVQGARLGQRDGDAHRRAVGVLRARGSAGRCGSRDG